MITLQNVTFAYSKKTVLTDFSLSVKTGETVCLSGASGCGKTTVLRLIAGLETPQNGTVSVNGTLAFVFQENRLLSWLTARDNIRLVAPDADADGLLKALGLPDVGDKPVGQLSGGMRRRVAIARALAVQADILLLDEPFNGLDDDTAEMVAQAIRSVYQDKTVVLVSHHQRDAELLGAKVLKMG